MMLKYFIAYGPDVLQLGGAGWLLWSSWRTRRQLRPLRATYDQLGDLMDGMRAALIDQFRDQTVGFAVIAVGLACRVAAPAL